MENQDSPLSFFARLGLAFRLLGDGAAARRAESALKAPASAPAASRAPSVPASSVVPASSAAAPAPKPVEPSPEQVQAQGLAFLGLLQREGRLIDFLKEDISSFGDADVGAAARVVHAGCRKTLDQYLTLEPALPGADGSSLTLAAGYDVQRVRLTGNVSGQPPFRGTLRHHGWVVTDVRLPRVSAAIDTRVIAPAEVEL